MEGTQFPKGWRTVPLDIAKNYQAGQVSKVFFREPTKLVATCTITLADGSKHRWVYNSKTESWVKGG